MGKEEDGMRKEMEEIGLVVWWRKRREGEAMRETGKRVWVSFLGFCAHFIQVGFLKLQAGPCFV